MDNKEKIFLIIEKIKQIENLHTDGDVAKIIDLSRGALSNYKRRGTVPLKKLSVYCEKKGIRLDDLFPKAEKRIDPDHRIQDILALLNEDPEGTEAVYHFLEAKKNFDRASKSMKQYLGKKLEVWFEFPSAGNGEPKGKGGPK